MFLRIFTYKILAGKTLLQNSLTTFTFDAINMFASTALHKLIQTQSWDCVEKRIASHPGEVRKLAECKVLSDPQKKSKALPLHHAVAQNPPKEVVEKLIGSYNKAVSTTETAYHRTVIHVACMNRADASVVDSVFRHYPPAIKIQDALKRLPIHYAIANGCKMVTLNLLLDEFPESVAVPDHRGWLILHIACGMRAPLSVVQLVYEKNPMAVLVLDEDGHSPLDLAKRDVIPKRAVDPKVICFLENAMKDERKKRGLSESDVVLMAESVPEYITVGGCCGDFPSEASKTSASSMSSSSAKKGIFRRG